MRHPQAGAADIAASVASVPVINAGDGANQHPTQTLLDLYAIQKTQGKLNGLTVNMVGDLKYGRAVHSLVEALRWFDPHFIFTSPEELNMPKKYLELLDREGVDYRQTDRIEDGLNICDVLYMTRVQQERFPDMDEYNKVKDVYRLSASMLGSVKPNMKIMHPAPKGQRDRHGHRRHPIRLLLPAGRRRNVRQDGDHLVPPRLQIIYNFAVNVGQILLIAYLYREISFDFKPYILIIL